MIVYVLYLRLPLNTLANSLFNSYPVGLVIPYIDATDLLRALGIVWDILVGYR